jgi:NAD(P)-dependent dehydrogenase (short-subunit alcohol dehydrogenase family)
MEIKKVSVVLLTGGSSGIGAATARLLAESGLTVYAGSRRGTVERPASRIIPVQLDVNDETSLKNAVERVVAEQGHLDAVICNAGNGIFGPIEGATDAEARYQFETCLFGSLKTIQACLPVFRRQGFGRIVTITSVMAILQLPFQGFYSAAKAALLSVSESLQMELKGTGIECCSVLPGDVSTGFTAARKFTGTAQDPGSPYRERMDRNLQKIEKDELGGMKPDVIARAVCRQLKKKHMAVRVIPRIDYGAVGLLVRILPERAKLWLLDLLYS